MDLHINEAKEHLMRAHLFEEQYVTLVWPKETSLALLGLAKEIVNLQLDTFIRGAKREEPRKEYARIEVESWFKPSANT